MSIQAGINTILDRVLSLEKWRKQAPSFGWGYVVSVDPLQVIREFDTTPLAGKPATATGMYAVGDRVLLLEHGRRALVFGNGGKGRTGARFSLDRARVSYGVTLGIKDRYVMQGMLISEADDNQWYTTRNNTGTQSDRETTIVSKIGASGSGSEEMTFVDAGHGDAVFIEKDANGQIYVWTYFIDWRFPTTDPQNRHNYVRVPWAPGSYTFPQVQSYRVPSISGVNWRANYDEFNGIVAFRRGGGANRTMDAYRLTDILSHTTLPPPLASGVVQIETGYGPVQNHAYMYETNQWIFLYGASTGPKAIASYNASGGLACLKEIHQTVNIDAFGYPYDFCEPEGLIVHHSPSGDVSLLFGIVTGPVYARKSHVYSVDMGVRSSALDLLAGSIPSDHSPWMRSSNSNAAVLSSGVSESGSFPFAVSISGGKVRLRGRVEGSFGGSAASQQVLVLAESFWPKSTRQTVCVLQGSGRVARLEISTSGPVTIYFPPGSTDTYSWVDFDCSEYWLANM